MTDLVTKTEGGEQPPATGGDAGKEQQPAAKKVTFTTEQQAEVDRIIAERLKRAEEKLKADAEAAKAAETEAAERERLEKEKNFQELASKHEGKAKELETQYNEAKARLERAEAILGSQVEAKSKGLPESLTKLLEGRDVFDQFEIVQAFVDAQPAAPEKPARTPTTPTPPAQGKGKSHVQEAIDRQNKQATARDPYADLFKG